MLRVTRLDVDDAINEARARDYLTTSFDRALLILGGLTSPLRRDADVFVAECEPRTSGHDLPSK
jgi:hypothetical protein